MLRMTSRSSAPSKFSTTALPPTGCTGDGAGGSPPPCSCPFTMTPLPLYIRDRSSVGLLARAAASASAGEMAPRLRGGVGRDSGGVRSVVAHEASASGIAQTRIPRRKGMGEVIVVLSPAPSASAKGGDYRSEG